MIVDEAELECLFLHKDFVVLYRVYLVQRTYEFRLYPNSVQSEKLHNTLGACSWVYNSMVEKIHKEGFQIKVDLNYFLTELKEQDGWLYSYHSKYCTCTVAVHDLKKRVIL
ncbi:MAG: helix-turn-helix domain-containing protein [Candidatus Nitrosotenuis sp.]